MKPPHRSCSSLSAGQLFQGISDCWEKEEQEEPPMEHQHRSKVPLIYVSPTTKVPFTSSSSSLLTSTSRRSLVSTTAAAALLVPLGILGNIPPALAQEDFLGSSSSTTSSSNVVLALEKLQLPSPPSSSSSLTSSDDSIYQLKSGVQFRNVREGQGPVVTTDSTTVLLLLHIQAMLRDGSTLIDTRKDNRPFEYQVGSAFVQAPSFTSSNKIQTDPPPIITPGLDDVILSRGTLVNGQKVPPMRQGGVRRVVVPAPLAYGNAGVSRYQLTLDATHSLRQPVPRDELIRYEIEILRCLPVPIQVPKENNDQSATIQVRACCSEEVYPCPTTPQPQSPSTK